MLNIHIKNNLFRILVFKDAKFENRPVVKVEEAGSNKIC